MNLPSRGGFALIAALISIVLVAALIAGTFLATTEDARVTGSEALGIRALNAAESAVQASLSGWAAGQVDSLGVGQRASRSTTDDGLPVLTTLVRLDSSVFWVVGEAGVSVQTGGAEGVIRRRVGLFIRRVSDSTGHGFFLRVEERAWSELF